MTILVLICCSLLVGCGRRARSARWTNEFAVWAARLLPLSDLLADPSSSAAATAPASAAAAAQGNPVHALVRARKQSIVWYPMRTVPHFDRSQVLNAASEMEVGEPLRRLLSERFPRVLVEKSPVLRARYDKLLERVIILALPSSILARRWLLQ